MHCLNWNTLVEPYFYYIQSFVLNSRQLEPFSIFLKVRVIENDYRHYIIYKWISVIFTFMLCTYLNSGSSPSLVIGSLNIIIFSNKKILRSLPFVFAFPSTTTNSSFTARKRRHQLIAGKKRTSQTPRAYTTVKLITFKSSRNICLGNIVNRAQSRYVWVTLVRYTTKSKLKVEKQLQDTNKTTKKQGWRRLTPIQIENNLYDWTIVHFSPEVKDLPFPQVSPKMKIQREVSFDVCCSYFFISVTFSF